jgi:hypothetical protein
LKGANDGSVAGTETTEATNWSNAIAEGAELASGRLPYGLTIPEGSKVDFGCSATEFISGAILFILIYIVIAAGCVVGGALVGAVGSAYVAVTFDYHVHQAVKLGVRAGIVSTLVRVHAELAAIPVVLFSTILAACERAQEMAVQACTLKVGGIGSLSISMVEICGAGLKDAGSIIVGASLFALHYIDIVAACAIGGAVVGTIGSYCVATGNDYYVRRAVMLGVNAGIVSTLAKLHAQLALIPLFLVPGILAICMKSELFVAALALLSAFIPIGI